jgi:uncharacterized protein YndB with AHSA1/START domain
MTITAATRTNASTVLPADPDQVFALLTDIDRLPSWNTELTAVLEKPSKLVPGAEWVVEMHAAGMTWPSRTRVIALDPQARRFVYRSVSDDGNPSFTIWTWTVDEVPGGARVSVTWDPNPLTFWRRAVVVHWRRRCLARQVPRSLRALAAALQPVTARP